MGPRQIWRELCKTVQGAVAFKGYLRSQETIDIALGMFEASSSIVLVGRPCRYVIRIANVSGKAWDVKVTLQTSSIGAAQVAAQPSASFAKHCTMPPRCATEIECHYDWHTAAVFMVDSVVSPPDEFYIAEIKTMQRYLVRAILCDHTGEHLDTLNIYQELQG
jgi:hypothetical protein